MRISDWSSDVCSSDLALLIGVECTDSQVDEGTDAGGEPQFLRELVGRWIVGELGDAGSENPRLGIVEGILDPRFLIARHGDEFGSAEVVTDRPAHDAEARAERLGHRSEEHKSELQSLMRISYAVY